MALYNDLLGIPGGYTGGNALYGGQNGFGAYSQPAAGLEDGYSSVGYNRPLAGNFSINPYGTPGYGMSPAPATPMVAPGAGATAFQNYLNNFGFQRELDQGSDAIRSSLASRRLLGSGATLKALQNYGLGLRDQYRTNYLNLLGNQQAMGLNAASALAGAQTNYTGQVTAANNARASTIGNAALAGAANNTNFLGSALSAAALLSDVRTKENIVKIGQLDEGPGIYRYNYRGDDAPQVGVLAQEVEQVRPDAVETGRDGLKRVNYLALTHRRAA